MEVQKTVQRNGNTLTHGAFHARETVHVCAARCRWANGALVTRRAQALQESILPHRSMGYDVMVLVGVERYLHHRQREEVQGLLLREHGFSLSTGTIGDLACLFGNHLRALHEARADRLRAALKSDGGWPLHVDATGENGRGTILIAYAGWRRWVLGAWKIPTERADAILPRLEEVVGLFGPPCAIVRDLGRAMIPAVNDLGTKLESPVAILSCHAHFLADVGEDLLDASHGALRKLFRQHKVRPALRGLARKILSSDLEHLQPEAALAHNLLCPDYVEILCGSLERLPQAFAELDAETRRRLLTAVQPSALDSCTDTPEIACASLPKADRRLIRSDAMGNRVLAAARSRAPRVNTTPARC